MTIEELKENWRNNPPKKAVCNIHGEHKVTLKSLIEAKRRGQTVGEWGVRFAAYGICCSTQQSSNLYW
jgi:hypothetical protein